MKTKTVGAFAAKTHLSALLDRVDRGQTFIITKRGRPVAELRPVSTGSKLKYGADKGKIWMSDDFDAPLPEFDEYVK